MEQALPDSAAPLTAESDSPWASPVPQGRPAPSSGSPGMGGLRDRAAQQTSWPPIPGDLAGYVMLELSSLRQDPAAARYGRPAMHAREGRGEGTPLGDMLVPDTDAVMPLTPRPVTMAFRGGRGRVQAIRQLPRGQSVGTRADHQWVVPRSFSSDSLPMAEDEVHPTTSTADEAPATDRDRDSAHSHEAAPVAEDTTPETLGLGLNTTDGAVRVVAPVREVETPDEGAQVVHSAPDETPEPGGENHTHRGDDLVEMTFPRTLASLTLVADLRGSLGLCQVRDARTGHLYVLKPCVHRNHCINEFCTNQAYRALGIRAPSCRVYENPAEPPARNVCLLAEYIGGTLLRNYLEEADADAKAATLAALREGFVADALLANWDVVGADEDNVVVDGEGVPWRVDNGGAMRFRAHGQPKGDAWNAETTELVSMRDANMNPGAAAVFGPVTALQVQQQLARFVRRLEHVRAVLPPADAAVLSQRVQLLSSRDITELWPAPPHKRRRDDGDDDDEEQAHDAKRPRLDESSSVNRWCALQ